MFEYNTQLFLFLHGFAYDAPHLWMFLASWFGVILAGGAFIFVGVHKHSYHFLYKKILQTLREWRLLVLIPAITWGAAALLKLAFAIPRPYMVLEIFPLSMPGTFDSFP